NLHLVDQVPDLDHQKPSGWNIYEVRNAPLVEGLRYEPVVATGMHGGTQSQCFNTVKPSTGPDPKLSTWECAAARWWRSREEVSLPFAASGPSTWARVEVGDLRSAPRKILPGVTVTDTRERDDEVSFHVSRVGVPVVVKESYFPNWKAHGARGPYRL